MILFVHSDKSKIDDFIMWADVEFAMQIELMEQRRFQDQSVTIIDLGELRQLGSIGQTEPLFVICHGGKDDPRTSLGSERYSWSDIGRRIGAALSGKPGRIELFACWAGAGRVGERPIDVFARGLGQAAPGIKVVAYQGATVTNTMGTVGAREVPGGEWHKPVLVANDNKLGVASQLDADLRKVHAPQMKFNAFMLANPRASASQKAIAAAAEASDFYLAFGAQLQHSASVYAVRTDLSKPVTVTS